MHTHTCMQVTKRSIPYTDFVDLCEECSIPQGEASRVAADLHKVGFLLHFSRDVELSATVYLRPEEVLEDFFSRYGMDRYACGTILRIPVCRMSILTCSHHRYR